MKYILKNIKNFACQETGFFVLCLCCIFCSIQVILTAYGVYGYYLNKREVTNEDWKAMDISFREYNGMLPTKKVLVDALKTCSENMVNDVDMFYVEVKNPRTRHFEERFCMQNKKIITCQSFWDNMKKNGLVSECISKEQDERGEKVALVSTEFTREKKIEILNQEYQVIGTTQWCDIMVPFSALADTTQLSETGLYISFKNFITKRDYDRWKEILEGEMGEYIEFPEMNVPDFNKIYFYNTMLYINLNYSRNSI